MSTANRGKLWERQLDRYHYALQSSGRAQVTRNHPEVTIKRGRGGQIIGATFRKTGAPDYTILSEGLTLMADAKSTQERRWKLILLEPHQAQTLNAVEHHGGLGLLLVNTPQGSWALPWDRVEPWWTRRHTRQAKRGEASLTAEQMDGMAVAYAPKGYALDYLQPALDYLKRRRIAA